MSIVYLDGKPGYAFTVSAGGSCAELFVDAATAEAKVASDLKINPVLEGPHIYLQFHSPGDGFGQAAEEQAEEGVTVGELVEQFLGDSYLDPAEFKAALVELEKDLRSAHLAVAAKARAIGATPDPFSPEFMPELRAQLKDLNI